MADHDHLTCTIVSPEECLFDGNATRVVAPGARGEIGVYPRHAALIAKLEPGVVRVHVPESEGGGVEKLAARGGFVEIADDHVTLLVTRAIRPADVDKETVERRLAETIAELKNPGSDERYRELLELRRWYQVCLAIYEPERLIQR